jgi:hypothetical protein
MITTAVVQHYGACRGRAILLGASRSCVYVLAARRSVMRVRTLHVNPRAHWLTTGCALLRAFFANLA